MPSLKRSKEPDTFNLGKTITLAISQAKILYKDSNELIDKVEYLKSRIKQEEQGLERVINEKKDVLSLKQQLTDKIIEKKSEFMDFVNSKQREIEATQASLAAEKADLDQFIAKSKKDFAEKEKELEIGLNELTTQKAHTLETVKQELRDDIANIQRREKQLTTQETENDRIRAELDHTTKTLEESTAKLDKAKIDLVNRLELALQREAELNLREKNIVEKEEKVEKARLGAGQTVADLENQLSLIERERSRNESERQVLKDMQVALRKRSSELDAREIHIADREATKLTH